MADFESFSASESINQGSSTESFRLFQERMKVAAAQIKAIKAGEQKQKKKEQELIKILTEFIKSRQSDSQNSDYLFHISRLLSLNCPAAFILGILLINFPELQVSTGFALTTFEEAMKAGAVDGGTLPDLYLPKNVLTPAMKIALDSWIQELTEIASDHRHKLLKNCLTAPDSWNPAITDFFSFSLQQYLQLYDVLMEKRGLTDFSKFFLAIILKHIQKPFNELNAQSEV